ncbi:MAG: hypothetical protein WD069_09675 [Planctomycetales bacterium]
MAVQWQPETTDEWSIVFESDDRIRVRPAEQFFSVEEILLERQR